MASGHRAGIVPAKFVPALPAGKKAQANCQQVLQQVQNCVHHL